MMNQYPTRLGETSYRRRMCRDPRELPVPAAWAVGIDQWVRWLRAQGRSRETIRTRIDHLRRLARALDGRPWTVSTNELTDWAAAQEWATETRRSVYASIRGFYSWAELTGLVATSPATDLPRVKPSPPAPHPCPAPVLAQGKAAASPRVLLMLRLGAEVGMRRAEIAQVHERDLVPDLLGWTLIVHGKGGRVRQVPISDELAETVRRACRKGAGFAFPGRIDGHLSPAYVGKLMARALASPGYGAHSLRHRFAAVVHHTSRDLLAVQNLLGHASPATTQRYVPVSSARLREVAAAAA